jgi:NAD(P)-dependent dehydrogenase (short-subunit alcohol dehydrogenase family)
MTSTPHSFDDQLAIVTGAASGIGAATAKILGLRGAHVVLADRDGEKLQEVENSLRAGGATVSSCATDISKPDEISALIDFAQQRGEVSVLVNSAGITGPLGKKTHELDIRDFDTTYSINLRGAVLLTMAVLPDMVAAGYGRIVHVASIAGKEGNPNMAPYNMAKAGLIGFVKGCGKEYATEGITVNAVAPAVIRSPMAEGEPPEQIEYMLGKIPMRRMGEPSEVAEVIAFAASRACGFTTGFVFDASGGRATY